MRITGGQYCNREIQVPKTDLIRPTQDRVRQAVFNIIQTEVAGCDFLDLFAGSGAVGLEALSRGAASATFVEQSRKHLEVLRKNLGVLCKPNIPTSQHPNNQVICSDVYRWLATYVGPGFSVGPAVQARRGEGLRAGPGDARGAERDPHRRTLHRGDDGGAEGGGDPRLGPRPRPRIRQDEDLHLAPSDGN